MSELFELIQAEVAKERPDIHNIKAIYRDFREGDVKHSQADISKACRLLGYNPAYSIKTGLAATSEWYMKNYNNIDVGQKVGNG